MKQMQTQVYSSSCLQNTLTIIGDKWTALLLDEISAYPRTFSELELALSGISPRTLSQRLAKLDSESIIQKKQYCKHPPRFRYELTEKGLELKEVIAKMADWGSRHSCQAK